MSSNVRPIKRKNEPNEPKPLTLEQMVEADKKERADRCVKAFNALLEEYRCTVALFAIMPDMIGGQKFPLSSVCSFNIELSIEAKI